MSKQGLVLHKRTRIVASWSSLICVAQFLILMELHPLCVRGLELFWEQIIHGKHVAELLTRDAARALHFTCNLVGCTALAMF
jgi:hypothetical protein